MGDPNDLLEISKHAGSGGLGAVLVALIGRAVLGGGMTEIKERVADLRADLKEQMASVHEMMKEVTERADRRHDEAVAKIADAERTANAAHHRYDALETRIDQIERDIRDLRRAP